MQVNADGSKSSLHTRTTKSGVKVEGGAQEAFEDLQNSIIDHFLLVPKSKKSVELLLRGTGGVSQMKAHLTNDKIFYG